jgi:hypothetical protein
MVDRLCGLAILSSILMFEKACRRTAEGLPVATIGRLTTASVGATACRPRTACDAREPEDRASKTPNGSFP